VGKKHNHDKSVSRKINVEIAPGNQKAMDVYIHAYNRRPERTTPKVGYTDVVNEALDRFLSSPSARGRSARPAKGRKKSSRVEREEDQDV